MSETKQSICFIVNPISGATNAKNIKALIQDNLDHDKFNFVYKETQYRGHATELAATAVKEGFNMVVACGGDGTVNEVAQELIHSESSLAIIPKGSGNGFAMHIGMGRKVKQAILMLNTAATALIDTCTINDRFFLNLAGTGFDALIAQKIDASTSRGFKLYLNTIAKEIINFKAETFRILVDDEFIEDKFSIIAVANAAMYGYNFNIAPTAKLSDGLMDVILIKKASKIKTLLSSWRMLNNTMDKNKLVTIKQAREVRIQLDKPYYYHIDGEGHSFEGELHFKVVPQSLKLVLPKERMTKVL